MKRREFLGCLGLGAASLAGCSTVQHRTAVPSQKPCPPNVIFILIDDLGYTDVGCFGSTFYETPNIDRLATSGVRFTQAYAACPVCSPTRASIMTGQYPARLKLTDFLKGKRSPEDSPILTAPYADQLPLEATTIAEILHDAGYTAAHIGKWHLGNDDFGPLKQGFDVNVGGNYGGGPRSYFWPKWQLNVPIKGDVEGEYLTDRLATEACRFIEANRDRPFFLNLCHYSVHIPLEAKADKIAKYEAKLKAHPPSPGQQNNTLYAAMIESVDECVGRIVATLDQCGVSQNTILFFFSDNGGLSVKEGPNTPATTNAPLRDGKGYLHEGGIREPLIVVWPGVVQPGSASPIPVCSVDFFPTICAMTGARVPRTMSLDGIDITPVLREPSATLHRDALYWHYPHFSNQGGRPSGAIRVGDWKLIEDYEHGKIELYNLADDIGETRNLAETESQRARHMLGMLKRWREKVDATMPPPNPAYRPPK